MTLLTCPANLRLQALQQLFSLATREASLAMSRWTEGKITLTLEEVHEIPLEDTCTALRLGNRRLTMVVLHLEGKLGCTIILTFDKGDGRQLAASLLRRPQETAALWSAWERSALTETGNIVGCAHMNVLARLLDRIFVPSAPYFLQDYGASVLQQALTAQALRGDWALICRTGFHREGRALNWHVLFVPTPALREAMENALYDV
jgi:chemotaxis protein CheC